MAAFKEGDWVRYKFEVCDLDAGTVAKIDKVYSPYSILTRTLDGRGYYATPSEVEPWAPKVGERVRCVEGTALITEGKEYAVERASESDVWVARGGGYGVADYPLHYFEPLPVAAEAQTAAPVVVPLTIQAGRFYKTRDGRKVGPMLVYLNNKSEWMIEVGDGNLWTAEGKHKEGCRTSRGEDFMHDGGDIIAEWPADTNTNTNTNVAATVDALDEEYGPVVRDFTNIAVNVTNIDDLDAVIAKLKKIRKLQRELGLIAA